MKKIFKIHCSVCGYQGNNFQVHNVVNDDLFETWGLSQGQRVQFDLRESSNCPRCHNSARTRALASAIIKKLPLRNTQTLTGWVIQANKMKLKVAEINSCGQLHRSLKKLKNLNYSEYVSSGDWKTRAKNWLKGISYQDIENLKYKNGSFDLVLHSEVLEHVNDPQRALAECMRVLKKDGVCIFTVPVILNRASRRRAKVVDGETEQLLKPSFHGSGENDNLVFWEFGKEVVHDWKVKIAYQESDKELYVFSKTN